MFEFDKHVDDLKYVVNGYLIQYECGQGVLEAAQTLQSVDLNLTAWDVQKAQSVEGGQHGLQDVHGPMVDLTQTVNTKGSQLGAVKHVVPSQAAPPAIPSPSLILIKVQVTEYAMWQPHKKRAQVLPMFIDALQGALSWESWAPGDVQFNRFMFHEPLQATVRHERVGHIDPPQLRGGWVFEYVKEVIIWDIAIVHTGPQDALTDDRGQAYTWAQGVQLFIAVIDSESVQVGDTVLQSDVPQAVWLVHLTPHIVIHCHNGP